MSSLTRREIPPAQRILFILPCCIGDVILATAALKALRRLYPQAHITWAVGSWSKGVIEHHDLLDAILDSGSEALPVKSLSGFFRFVQQIRAGGYHLVVSLVRSPLMSLAVLCSGIRYRAGLDSAGRGFGYSIRARIEPTQGRHEAEVYLDVIRALGGDTHDCWANVPVHHEDMTSVKGIVSGERLIVLHPGGGHNPGMVMDAKRWPPGHFARLGERLAKQLDADLVLVGGPGDAPIVSSVVQHLSLPYRSFIGTLSFGQLAALAQRAQLYIGNDTGLTHLAAAAGGRTVMILGPSDPARYAPFVPNALALWKPTPLPSGGVSQGAPTSWDWARDGIGVEEAEEKIQKFLTS